MCKKKRESIQIWGEKSFPCPQQEEAPLFEIESGNDLVTNKEDLLCVWADHLTELSKSKINDSEGLQRLNDKVQSLFNESL